MYMHAILILSCLAAFITGAFSMMIGKWEHFALKHAAMLLSTVTSFFTAAMLIMHPNAIECTASDIMCANWSLYGIASNARIIMFHIAIGRDAIRFKNQDRRGNKHGRQQGTY